MPGNRIWFGNLCVTLNHFDELYSKGGVKFHRYIQNKDENSVYILIDSNLLWVEYYLKLSQYLIQKLQR